MIIFLYGEDSYRIKEKEKEIISEYKKKHRSGLNLKYFDFLKDSFSFKDISYQSLQKSIFKEKKLYVIYNPFSNKEIFDKDIEKLVELDDIFLLIEGKISEKDKIFKKIQKISSSQGFQLLTGLKLKNWVENEFEKYGKKIEEKEITLFIFLSGNDLWKLNNEIKKIADFSSENKISEEDIRIFLKEDLKNDIFKTIDAIGEKNKKNAIKLIRLHMEKGEDPLYLLSMITYQFRNILSVKDLIEKKESYNEALKKTKLHPFVFRKTFSQSSKFSFLELKKIYGRLAEIDFNIKTGREDKETSLEMLIANL